MTRAELLSFLALEWHPEVQGLQNQLQWDSAARFVFQLQLVGVQKQKDLQWCKTQSISKTEASLKYLKMFFILILQKSSAAAIAWRITALCQTGMGMLILQDVSAVLVQKQRLSWWMWELIPGNSLKSLLGTPTQNGSGFSLVCLNENFLQANPEAAINHERCRDLCVCSWNEYGDWLM